MVVYKGASLAPTGETRPNVGCEHLLRVSHEFHALIYERCPRCQGIGSDCIVEQLVDLVEAHDRSE